MKLIIEKETLVNNLENVSRALSTRNIIPVLNGIKFKVTKEGLYLTASDNDISIEIFVDKVDIKSIEEEGELVISGGSKLLEILRKLPNNDMTIESYEENMIFFKTPNFEYKSNCYPKEEYPDINFEESDKYAVVNSNKVREMISKTSFACSLQESRPLFTGINVKLTNNNLEFVATDSYRLSKMQIEIDNKEENDFNIVIPARNINELLKVLNKEDDVYIHIFSNKVLFKYNNIKFQSSLINGGTYPNTDNSIPKSFESTIKVNIKEFFNVVERASLVSQFKDKNIIEMEIVNDKLTIRASSVDVGKIEESIIVDNVSKSNIKISYSAKYMIDALKIFNKENIFILLNGDISPIILMEEDNDELTELISPMKTF